MCSRTRLPMPRLIQTRPRLLSITCWSSVLLSLGSVLYARASSAFRPQSPCIVDILRVAVTSLASFAHPRISPTILEQLQEPAWRCLVSHHWRCPS